MKFTLYDSMIWLVPLMVGFYTITYARWLWRQKQKRAAIGVATLAGLATLYPGYVLFFVHK